MLGKSRAIAYLTFFVVLMSAAACSPGYKGAPPVVGPKDTADSALGERLFREPRFSKYFSQQSAGDPNATLTVGDPALGSAASARRGTLANPFTGQAMSCVACHMVGDAANLDREGPRAYTDFTNRTVIPTLSADSLITTPRNTPTLLGSLSPRDAFVLHFDGEFASIEDLIIGSYTSRNFGWLPSEVAAARANLVNVIRNDAGQATLAKQFGNVAYREMFLAKDSAITPGYVISEPYRVDISTLSDDDLINQVVTMVKVYLQALQFSTDLNGVNNGSAYDHFLAANHLPQGPKGGESDLDYATRLSIAIQRLGSPIYVNDDSGTFGAEELEGAKIFFARADAPSPQGPGFFQVGNCVACHAPPHFTDFRMHNTGAAQDEYDALHGLGSFMALAVPNQADRLADPNDYLPATPTHPAASGRFRMPPAADHPEFTDLGAWNIFGNYDYPNPQNTLSQFFCPGGTCASSADTDQALSASLGAFKTPGLRLLGMSDPYLHTGTKATVTDVLHFYQTSSNLARAGTLRNADPLLSPIQINNDGVTALAAFLNSLNEDYE